MKPHTDFIWQRYRDESDMGELTEEEAEFNTLDIDIPESVLYITNQP